MGEISDTGGCTYLKLGPARWWRILRTLMVLFTCRGVNDAQALVLFERDAMNPLGIRLDQKVILFVHVNYPILKSQKDYADEVAGPLSF